MVARIQEVPHFKILVHFEVFIVTAIATEEEPPLKDLVHFEVFVVTVMVFEEGYSVKNFEETKILVATLMATTSVVANFLEEVNQDAILVNLWVVNSNQVIFQVATVQVIVEVAPEVFVPEEVVNQVIFDPTLGVFDLKKAFTDQDFVDLVALDLEEAFTDQDFVDLVVLDLEEAFTDQDSIDLVALDLEEAFIDQNFANLVVLDPEEALFSINRQDFNHFLVVDLLELKDSKSLCQVVVVFFLNHFNPCFSHQVNLLVLELNH